MKDKLKNGDVVFSTSKPYKLVTMVVMDVYHHYDKGYMVACAWHDETNDLNRLEMFMYDDLKYTDQTDMIKYNRFKHSELYCHNFDDMRTGFYEQMNIRSMRTLEVGNVALYNGNDVLVVETVGKNIVSCVFEDPIDNKLYIDNFKSDELVFVRPIDVDMAASFASRIIFCKSLINGFEHTQQYYFSAKVYNILNKIITDSRHFLKYSINDNTKLKPGDTVRYRVEHLDTDMERVMMVTGIPNDDLLSQDDIESRDVLNVDKQKIGCVWIDDIDDGVLRYENCWAFMLMKVDHPSMMDDVLRLLPYTICR